MSLGADKQHREPERFEDYITDTPPEPKRDNTTPSCAVCQRRKVKCNRVYPCAPCQKTGLECSFKPQQIRHRQKRVKRCNDIGDDNGGEESSQGAAGNAKFHNQSTALPPHEQSLPSPASAPNSARLVPDAGGYRYVNNHSWSAMSPTATTTGGSTPGAQHAASIRSPEGRSGDSIYESAVQLGSEIAAGPRNDIAVAALSEVSTAASFIFRQAQSTYGGQSLETEAQPSPGHIIHLWQAYLARVDPIMKILHAPTTQEAVLGQIGRPYLAANEQALTSAIYLISTVSLTDAECRTTLQEDRSGLVRRFRQATEDALSAASFVTTKNIMVLQAFVLYLAALRSLDETPFVRSMTGLAIRIAGTIGLARDASLWGLQPFVCEMRRRLWWAIVDFDARTAELRDRDGDLLHPDYNVQPPSKINDSELFPNMQRMPEGRPAATDMIYVQLRATLASSLRTLPEVNGHVDTWQRMRAWDVPVSEKLEIVEALEKKLDDDFLCHCDATVPLQLLVMNSAQTLLNKLRLVGNVPVARETPECDSDGKYPDNELELSMRIMQLQLALWTDSSLQKWRWHWQGQFQWYALSELIYQTRVRRRGPATPKAWTIIRKVFDIIIPTLEIAKKKSLLLEAFRALLRAATIDLDQSTNTPSEPAATSQAPFSGSNPTVPVAQMATPSKTRVGSRPHNALLPGIDPAISNPTDGHQCEEHTAPSIDDVTLGIDLDAIDWSEFDRLTTELCGP